MLQLIEEDETFYDLSELHKVPKKFKKVIKQFHNSMVGHHGVERTLQKLQSSGNNWTNMRQHVRTHIARCPCCQMMSQVAPQIRANPFTLSHSKPMHSLAIDTIGPLPEDEKGNKYLIAIIDIFSRFLELYPAVDATALSAADAILQHTGRYGTPSLLISDAGSQYVNEVISQYLSLMGTDHHITLAYSKQENGIIERSNKEILRHLKAIIFERSILRTWTKSLPLVQRIINSSVHDSIGVSPAQIIFGDSLNLNRGFIVSVEDKEKFDSEVVMTEYSQDMIERQAHIIAIAQKHQTQVNEHYIDSKNEKYKDMEVTTFPVNSYVLVGYPDTSLKKGPPTKFMTNWQGPYRVVSSIGNHYTVLHLSTMKQETVSIKRLKEYLLDEDIDPQQVANQATKRDMVERIVSHTGNANYRKKMTFEVKWLGYGPEENTFEPWTSELWNLEVMHEYLRANKLKQLIPAKFK